MEHTVQDGTRRIRGKKEQVVETTCGSHEKTSKDNLFKIRGSCPLDKMLFPRNKFMVEERKRFETER
jgi:spore coat polysaccharide biosynthesis protein SpsF (cytidylyltransferase family)